MALGHEGRQALSICHMGESRVRAPQPWGSAGIANLLHGEGKVRALDPWGRADIVHLLNGEGRVRAPDPWWWPMDRGTGAGDRFDFLGQNSKSLIKLYSYPVQLRTSSPEPINNLVGRAQNPFQRQRALADYATAPYLQLKNAVAVHPKHRFDLLSLL